MESEYSLWTRDPEDGVLAICQRLSIGFVPYAPLGVGFSPAQLALAWVLARGEHIVPIPGTKRLRYRKENIAATAMQINAQDLDRLGAAFPRGAASGARYGQRGMRFLRGDPEP